MKIEEYTDPQSFLNALHGKRQKRGKATRPDMPRADAGEGDRSAALMRIARYGFHPRWRAGIGHDFWHVDGRTTTICSDYAAAVILAEKEVRR